MPAVSKMSFTDSRVPAGGSSSAVMKTCSKGSAAPATGASVGALQARPGHVPLDHRAQKLLDLALAADLDVTTLIGVAPVIQLPSLGELVEVRPRQRELEPRVVGLALGDDRPGYPDAEDLDVPPSPQLEADHQLEVPERRDLRGEAAVGRRDQILRAGHRLLGPGRNEMRPDRQD